MSFVMSVTLQCDFRGCAEEYEGEQNFTLEEVREEARMDDWAFAKVAGRPLEGYRDFCPTHAEGPVTA